jgi:hypothetical protein
VTAQDENRVRRRELVTHVVVLPNPLGELVEARVH